LCFKGFVKKSENNWKKVLTNEKRYGIVINVRGRSPGQNKRPGKPGRKDKHGTKQS